MPGLNRCLSLASQRPLLVAMPMRVDLASTLMGEFGEIDRYFSMELVEHYPQIALYRLKPH